MKAGANRNIQRSFQLAGRLALRSGALRRRGIALGTSSSLAYQPLHHVDVRELLLVFRLRSRYANVYDSSQGQTDIHQVWVCSLESSSKACARMSRSSPLRVCAQMRKTSTGKSWAT